MVCCLLEQTFRTGMSIFDCSRIRASFFAPQFSEEAFNIVKGVDPCAKGDTGPNVSRDGSPADRLPMTYGRRLAYEWHRERAEDNEKDDNKINLGDRISSFFVSPFPPLLP